MSEVFYSGQMCKSRFRTKIGDNRSLLRQAARCYDLMKDRAQGLFREFILVVFQQTRIYLAFFALFIGVRVP
ncbi:MAG: hypothetical protein P8Y04_14000 [Desulfobulbaceae bacterium]